MDDAYLKKMADAMDDAVDSLHGRYPGMWHDVDHSRGVPPYRAQGRHHTPGHWGLKDDHGWPGAEFLEYSNMNESTPMLECAASPQTVTTGLTPMPVLRAMLVLALAVLVWAFRSVACDVDIENTPLPFPNVLTLTYFGFYGAATCLSVLLLSLWVAITRRRRWAAYLLVAAFVGLSVVLLLTREQFARPLLQPDNVSRNREEARQVDRPDQSFAARALLIMSALLTAAAAVAGLRRHRVRWWECGGAMGLMLLACI